MEFETKPISELSNVRAKNDIRAAFEKLAPGMAMFIPRGDRKTIVPGSFSGGFAVAFPDRKISSKLDKEKDGIWLWWEPKE